PDPFVWILEPQRERTPQERRDRLEVREGGGSAGGLDEMCGGALAERVLLIPRRAALATEPGSLLPVVAEDLLAPRHPVAGDPLQPAGELLVEGRAEPLRSRAVRGFANEDVLEPERDLAGDDLRRGADEVPSRERFEPAGHTAPRLIDRQLDDR